MADQQDESVNRPVTPKAAGGAASVDAFPVNDTAEPSTAEPLDKTSLLFLYGDPYGVSDDEKSVRRKKTTSKASIEGAQEGPSQTTFSGLDKTRHPHETSSTFAQTQTDGEIVEDTNVDLRIPVFPVSTLEDTASSSQFDLPIRSREHSSDGTIKDTPLVAESVDYEIRLQRAQERIADLENEMGVQLDAVSARDLQIKEMRRQVRRLEKEKVQDAGDLQGILDHCEAERNAAADEKKRLLRRVNDLALQKEKLEKEKKYLTSQLDQVEDENSKLDKALILRDKELMKAHSNLSKEGGDDAARDAMEYVRGVEEERDDLKRLVKELQSIVKELTI